MVKKWWSRLDITTKLSMACIALYISLYAVIDIAEWIGRTLAWILI